MSKDRNLPSYEELFGSIEFKKGAEARSVYSPAAYLTDLLQLIEDSFQPVARDNPAEGAAAPAEEKTGFEQRRGDIKNILLNKANTFERVPYLDIVNDLLQALVEAGNNGKDAFEVLKTNNYPFNLPMDLDYERVKKLLGHMNIRGEELYELFSVNPDADTAARAFLGISPEEYQFFLQDSAADEAKLKACYGLEEGQSFSELSEVDRFLANTGLNETELVELLYQNLSEAALNNQEKSERGKAAEFYVNNGLQGSVGFDEEERLLVWKNQAGETVGGPPSAWFERCSRFIRLAKKTGFSFTDLDLMLRACCGNRLDAEAIRRIAVIRQIGVKYEAPVDVVCAFFSDINSLGIGDEEEPQDLFNRTFNGKYARLDNAYIRQGEYVPAQYHSRQAMPYRELVCSGDILSEGNREYRKRLLRGLRLSDRDFELIVTTFRNRLKVDGHPGSVLENNLGIAGLSLLFRISRLVEVLDISVQELFDVFDFLQLDGAIRSKNLFRPLIPFNPREVSCYRILERNGVAVMDCMWLTQALMTTVKWMQTFDFTAIELRQIQTGYYETAKAEQDDRKQKWDVLRALRQQFESTSLTAGSFEGDRFDARNSRVIYDSLIASKSPVISGRDGRLVTYEAVAAKSAAYQAMAQLNHVFKSDFKGLKISEKMLDRLFGNLINRGYINAEGYVDEAKLALNAGDFLLETDFSAQQAPLFNIFHDLYLEEFDAPEPAPGSGAGQEGLEFEFSVYLSDLAPLELTAEEASELYDTLIFNGYIDEEGRVQTVAFFANPEDIDDFELGTSLNAHSSRVREIIAAQIAGFETTPCALQPEIFDGIGLSETETRDLIENLQFNGHIDGALFFGPKAALLSMTVDEFELALQFYPCRKKILDSIQDSLKAFKAEYFTLKKESFEGLAEEIVAANCFELLSGWYLEAGRIRKEQEEFFRSAENADTFLLGSYFTPSHSRSVFNVLHAISLIPYTYQLQGPLLDNLGFLPEETEELFRQLSEAEYLDHNGDVTAQGIEYFLNVNHALKFRLEGFEDFDKEIFFALHSVATEYQSAIDQIDATLQSVAISQEQAVFEALAEGFETSSEILRVVCQYIFRSPDNLLESILLPVLVAVDSSGNITQEPADANFNLAYRRIGQFIRLANKLGLDEKETEVAFQDQDLVEKFPEKLALPEGVNGFDALLENFDGKILAFRGDRYWSYDAKTFQLAPVNAGPDPLSNNASLDTLSEAFAGLNHVDAAFFDPAGNAWIISGDQYFVREKGDATWKSRKKQWGRLQNNFADPKRIDASFTDGDGKIYLFSGDQYLRCLQDFVGIDDGYPKTIKEFKNEFATFGLPARYQQSIDASFENPEGKIFFFKDHTFVSSEDFSTENDIAAFWGHVQNNFTNLKSLDAAFALGNQIYLFSEDQVVRYTNCIENKEVCVDEGFPIKLTTLLPRLPSHFAHGIDAIFHGADGAIHIFRNGRYAKLSADFKDLLEESDVAEKWGKVRNNIREKGAVDAAFVGLDGAAYLFSGDQYYRYSTKDYSRVDEGYPRKVEGNWGGLLSVSEAFVLDGKTYLFGKDVSGNERFVRYSTRDYAKPDDGYPQPLDQEFWFNLPESLIHGIFAEPDAIFTGLDGNTYLFSGTQFIYFDHLHRWWSEPQSLKTKWDSIPFDKVDAAFTGEDGKTYIFSGNQYIRYSDPGYDKIDDHYPRRIDDFWGAVVNNIEKNRRVDSSLVVVSKEIDKDGKVAIAAGADQHIYTYLFSGNQYYRYKDNRYDVVEDGFPRYISTSLHKEPRLLNLKSPWRGGIDAAFADQRNVYLFQDDTIHIVADAAYRNYKARLENAPSCVLMDEGAVFIEDSGGWAHLSGLEGAAGDRTGDEPPTLRKAPDAFKTGLSSMLAGTDGNTYLFKGGDCYNVLLEKSYPTKEEWGKIDNRIVEDNHVDAALVGADGKIYLFSGDQFVTYTPGADAKTTIPLFTDGLPQSIEDHWGGLTRVSVAFVREGKTYLMEEPDEEGKFRYVCYSSADYSRPDQSSPLIADFSWWEIPQIYQEEGFRRVDAVIVDADNLFLIQGTEFISYNQVEGVWSYARPMERIWRGLKFNDTDFRRVTTALKGPDGKMYFFSKEAFVVHDAGVVTAAQKIRTRWGTVDNHIAQSGKIDAAFVWDDRETYLFSGDQYVKYSGWDYQFVDQGYPKLIAEGLPEEAVFKQLPDEFAHRLKLMAEKKIPFSGAIANRGAVYLFEERNMHAVSPDALWYAELDIIGAVKNRVRELNRVDAAYINARDQLILFSGDQYIRYSNCHYDFVDEGFPRRIGDEFAREEGFIAGANVFPYDIDTAVKTAAGAVFLFKDNQYVMSNDHGAKKELKELLGDVRNNFAPTAEGANISVDAAFVAPDGKTYVFKGDQYIRYSKFDNAYVDEGFPKRIKDNWGNLPVEYEKSLDGGFVFDGKTYLLKEKEAGAGGKQTEYVRYSRRDYKKIDSIYPQWMVNRWGKCGDYLLADLQILSRYKRLQSASSGAGANLTDFLNCRGDYQAEPYQKLHEIFGWDPNEAMWLKRKNGFLPGANIFEVHFNLEMLEKMDRVFSLTEAIGSNPTDLFVEVWQNLFSNSPDFKKAGDALYRQLGLNNSGQDWEILSSLIHNELNELNRDAWVPLVLHQDPALTRPRDLFESLLIDVEMGSCATTSKIKEAISALQLYFHRYFVNLEPVDLSPESGIDREELKRRWEWMKNYRVWEANRKVFLYPENYIRPELRASKTPAFKTLEDDLLQAEIIDEAVEKAYKKYLDEYTEVSRLTIAGGYVYDDLEDKKLILFGRTKTDPRRYYYRFATFPKGSSESAVWEPWQKLNLQIDADRVYPVYAFGRVFVFWAKAESETEPADKGTIKSADGGQTVSSDAQTDYFLRIYFSFHNLSGEWVPAQLFDAEVKRERPITDIKLLVENSERISKDDHEDDHENILVSCSFTSVDAADGGDGKLLSEGAAAEKGAEDQGDSESIFYSLTPELYTSVVQKPAFQHSGLDVFKNIFLEDIQEDKIVNLNTPEDSTESPWFSFDLKGGSFLCKPAAPVLSRQVEPRILKENNDSLLPHWEKMDAAFLGPDGKVYFFRDNQFTDSDNLESTRNTKNIWGRKYNKIADTGVVDAAYQDGNKTFLFSGDQYLRFSGQLELADPDCPKQIGSDNQDPMPKWSQIDAAFKAADGLTYFFNNDKKAFVALNLLGKLSQEVPYEAFWDATNVFDASVRVNAAFVKGSDTYLIGAGKILKYSGTTFEWVEPGYPKENSLFNLLEVLGCANNKDEYKKKPVLNANFAGTDLHISIQDEKEKDENYKLSAGEVRKLKSAVPYTGFVLEDKTFEFNGKSLTFDNQKKNLDRNIDAAFASDDGNVYLFSDGEFLVIPKDGLTGDSLVDAVKVSANFRAIGAKWGKLPSVIGRLGVVDAALQDGNRTYIFSGGQYYSYTREKLDADSPKPLNNNGAGFPEQPINAAFKDANGNKTYFFIGTKFTDSGAGTAQDVKARWGTIRNRLTETGKVDAAYAVSDHVFLLSGTEFVRYTAKDGKIGTFIDAGYPKSIKWSFWTITIPAIINAAYYSHEVGKTYLFSGASYFKLDAGAEPDNLPIPKPIKGNWGNLPAKVKYGFDAALEVKPAGANDGELELFLFKDDFYFKLTDARPFETEEAKYDIIRLTTSTGYKLNQILFFGGIKRLLSLESQMIDEVPRFQLAANGAVRSDSIIVNKQRVNEKSLPANSHLDFESSNGLYYWEMFFHAPFLIAQTLRVNQRFELAKRWYENIYDPTEVGEYWKFVPFLAVDIKALTDGIQASVSALKKMGVNTKPIEKDAQDIVGKLLPLAALFQGMRDKTDADVAAMESLKELTKVDADGATTESPKGLAKVKEEILKLTGGKNQEDVEQEKQRLVELIEIIEKLVDQPLPGIFTDSQLKTFLDDPFDPHAIAAIRKVAYRKAIVMSYVENLLEWGDMLFRQYTEESINEARMLYVLAYDLLGKKPVSMGSLVLGGDHTYNDLVNQDPSYQFLFFLKHGKLADTPSDAEAIASVSSQLQISGAAPESMFLRPYFFIPENEVFLEYWDRVEDRLYKIRQCLNIMGVKQPLPLFEPPINPMALVQAAAAGSLAQVTAGATVAVPHYKFEFLTFKLQNLLQKLNQFGSDLLLTMEKKDAEALSSLQNKQEGAILSMMVKLKEAQLQETEQTILYLEESKHSAHERAAHFSDLIKAGMLNEETQQFNLLVASAALNYACSVLKIAAMIGSGAPDTLVGPFIMGIKHGGSHIGQMLTAGSDVLMSIGQALSVTGEAFGVKAQFERMKQDWEFQLHVAESEEKQIGFQLEAARFQKLALLQDLAISKKQVEHNESIQTFFKEKFTNQQLYLWMIGKLSGLYYQTYKLSFEMAKSAEKAFQFERGLPESEVNFINGQYWDSQRKGLLAGASLGLDVDRMEKAFIETNSRRLEITKNVSLLDLDPLAFLQLKTGGVCEFSLSEGFFDYDFPGHYCRQVKTIALTFDAGEGVVVNATLTQLTHKTVMEPDLKAVKFLLNPKDQPPASIRSNWRPNQQIALSHHDEYEKNNGLFELRFDNDRYLPFEGTGAVSLWRLELNGKKGAIDLRNLVDVTINLKYTALQGGPVFAEAVKGMLKPYEALRFFDMTFDFADQWNEFLDGDGNEFSLLFTRDLFQNMGSSKIAGIFTKYDLAGPGEISMTLNGNKDWRLQDGKYLETIGLNIGSQGSDLRFSVKGDKNNLRNIQFVFSYKANVS